MLRKYTYVINKKKLYVQFYNIYKMDLIPSQTNTQETVLPFFHIWLD